MEQYKKFVDGLNSLPKKIIQIVWIINLMIYSGGSAVVIQNEEWGSLPLAIIMCIIAILFILHNTKD